MKRICQPT